MNSGASEDLEDGGIEKLEHSNSSSEKQSCHTTKIVQDIWGSSDSNQGIY